MCLYNVAVDYDYTSVIMTSSYFIIYISECKARHFGPHANPCLDNFRAITQHTMEAIWRNIIISDQSGGNLPSNCLPGSNEMKWNDDLHSLARQTVIISVRSDFGPAEIVMLIIAKKNTEDKCLRERFLCLWGILPIGGKKSRK